MNFPECKLKLIFSVTLAGLLLISCQAGQPVSKSFRIPYNLTEPDGVYLLIPELTEISGIAFDNEKLLCINDESADIFVFDLLQKKVVRHIQSGFKGDYEDIAVKGTTAFLIRSSGAILEINNFLSGGKITEYNTPLSSGNNTEGLAFCRSMNSLLIACKEYSDLRDENIFKGQKTIYRFDLASQQLSQEPFLKININDQDCFADTVVFRNFQSFRESVSGGPFKPSGLSLHPGSNELFIISSTARLLLRLDSTGKISRYSYLPPEIFRQSEGICFSDSGDLYISNEGQGSSIPNILKFIKKN